MRKSSPELTHAALYPQLRILRRYLRAETVLLEVGPGDCSLSIAVAPRVRQVLRPRRIAEDHRADSRSRQTLFILSDGAASAPPDSVDVTYSNPLMEHLRPDDALEQLAGIWRALRPGGVYICITPSRLNGPHDVSQHFDSEAKGFHLKEYTVSELNRLFRRVGSEGPVVDRPARPVRACAGRAGACR